MQRRLTLRRLFYGQNVHVSDGGISQMDSKENRFDLVTRGLLQEYYLQKSAILRFQEKLGYNFFLKG